MNFTRSLPVLSACALLYMLSLPPLARAAEEKEKLTERYIGAIIDGCFQLHFSRQTMTPALAAATLSNYVEMLDFSRFVFRDSDVAMALAYTGRVERYSSGTDWSFITNIYSIFLDRLDDQQTNAIAYLSRPGLTLDEHREVVTDVKQRSFPRTPGEAQQLLEDTLQYQLAYLVSIGEPFTGAVAKVVKRRERLAKRYHDLRNDLRLGLFINAFCRALDPHTAYLSADDLEDFQIGMALQLEGIGAVLGMDDDGITKIESLTPGAPADRSGNVKQGDKIVAVAQGGEGAFVDIIDMDLRDVVKLIRGKKGTVVRLKIVRKTKQGNQRFDVDLTRDKVRLEDQAPRMDFVTAVRTNANNEARSYTFAAIDLPSFYFNPDTKVAFGKYESSATADLRRFLDICRTAGVDGVILDLQRNGGGALEEAVDVAGLFLRRGNVVMALDRRGGISTLSDTDSEINYGGPLAVTVSRGTASGAEIVAGALQDYGRAFVIGGDHTFGKSTIQQVIPLPDNLGALKITVGEYLIASGRSMQKTGVEPHIVLPSPFTAMEIGEQYEPSALPGSKLPSNLSGGQTIGDYADGWARITTDQVAWLAIESSNRVAQSKDLSDVAKAVAKAIEDRKKKSIIIGAILKEGRTNGTNDAGSPINGESDEDEEQTISLRRPSLTNDPVVLEAAQILADSIAGIPPVIAPPAAVPAGEPIEKKPSPWTWPVRAILRLFTGRP